MTDADQVIRRLDLKPLAGEGGYFVETWRGPEAELPPGAGSRSGARRPLGSAIYYLVTPDSFSALHRLRSDEVFHFYLGDPCEMLLLGPDGESLTHLLGVDLAEGMRPQVVVPAGWWQGTRLRDQPGGRFALLGTTMAPGYHPDDFELADRVGLLREYPEQRHLIEPFFPR
jgi:uncharacterized protein